MTAPKAQHHGSGGGGIRLLQRHGNLVAALFGLVAVLGILGLFEGGFHVLNQRKIAEKGIRYVREPEYRVSDDDLGVKPIPGIRARHAKYFQDKLVFDATYTIDAFSRRVVPKPKAAEKATEALLFFGCSFTFGTGVEDDETLPAYMAQDLPRFHVYNYAFQGYGPQHMLAKLEEDTLADELDENRAFLLYVFIPDHIRRVIGSRKVVCGWAYGDRFPYYDYDGHGVIRRFGSFATGRPWRQRWYGLLQREQCMRYFEMDWPPRLTTDHMRLTADVLRRAVEVFAKQYGPDRACIVLYPGDVRYSERSMSGRAFIPYLEAAGLPYLDCTDAFDLGDDGFAIPHDGHPTPKAHRMIAGRIAAYLERATLTHGATRTGMD